MDKVQLSKVHYNHFHIAGVTDESQIKKEAEFRFAQPGRWISIVHQHRSLEECEGKCQIIQSHTHKLDCRVDCDFASEWVTIPV